MRFRIPASFAILSLALFCVAPALADGSSSASGAGGASSPQDDPNCTVAAEQVDGTTCQACNPSTGACSDQLDGTFSFVCRHDAMLEVWCDGPPRTLTDTSNAACAIGAPRSAPCGLAAASALVVAAALLRRRRR